MIAAWLRNLRNRFHKAHVCVIADDEQIARYVLSERNVRKDNTIKPDEFIPHPHADLSVTRHNGFSDEQIWRVGRAVATARKRPLCGRADFAASTVRKRPLDVKPDPIAGNPNHAIITGWPPDKSKQKSIALEIAAASVYHPLA